ncbi:helix-turn-helix domain-containing protein [Nocardia sp. R7R-8]|uniref:helix-turn-helix domain-containing protein n=1 Tax=Nocardia sp. R7R-8 TaxID=3459304 RepID=UPI00403DC288
MAGREPEYGPTAKTVGANIARLRKALDLNYKEVSERLKSVAEWDISPVGVRRMEESQRRVTVDDLVALSVALNCSPLALLLPPTSVEHVVTITGAEMRPGWEVWDWGKGERPLLLGEMLEAAFPKLGRSDRIRAAQTQYRLNSDPTLQGVAGAPNVFLVTAPDDEGEADDGDD